MTIYEELKSDHKALKETLNELAMAESAEKRRILIEKVRDELVPHSRAEEAVFYNVLRDMDEAKDLLTHSYGEHVKAEGLLRALQVTEAVALKWKSGVTALQDAINHHIAEEEGKIFHVAKKVISFKEAGEIGKAFVELKAKVGSGVVASQLELLVNLMPQRLRQSFVKYWTNEKEGGVKRAS